MALKYKDIKWKEVMYMAATIWGEARGESFDGKVAVGWVIRNRAERPKWWGNSVASVVTKPWQFSCWNDNDPNSPMVKDIALNWRQKTDMLLDEELIQECIMAALQVLHGKSYDKTEGSTHYYNPDVVQPAWASGKTPVGAIGSHKFYNNVE